MADAAASHAPPDADPGVSVIIPAFNEGPRIGRAIDSALAQDWPTIEIVVVDDGSTDETPDVLRNYQQAHPQTVRVITQSNLGVSMARNAGIVACRFPFIAFLDSDDEWHPTKLRRQMTLMASDPELEFCFTAVAKRLAATGELEFEIWDEWDDSPARALDRMLVRNCIANSSVLISRERLLKLGPFDSTLVLAQDYDMWLRAANAGCRLAYVPEPLTTIVRHGANSSRNVRVMNRETEQTVEQLFRTGQLPATIKARRRWYLAHRYLNDACHYLETGNYSDAAVAILTASLRSPASARPGWLRVLLNALTGMLRGGVPSHDG